jgi:hypothetical protein
MLFKSVWLKMLKPLRKANKPIRFIGRVWIILLARGISFSRAFKRFVHI